MHVKTRTAAFLIAAASLGLGTAAVTAGPASASTPGCAFSNGCATLHGTDALGRAVAMDAKYQNKNEIEIGYADNVGDTATSFDGVLHSHQTRPVNTWDDTGLGPFTADPPVYSNVNGATKIQVTNFADDPSTGVITITVKGGTAPYTATLTGLQGATVTSPITKSSGGSFNADISVNGATNAQGFYNNIVLTITDSATPTPQTVTYTGSAEVFAHRVTIPSSNEPYYTYVYAPNGTWTNQCVTDINGSGALKLSLCTNGHDAGQDFTTDAAGGLLGATPAHISNLLAASVGSKSCLVDPSVSNPTTPQSDAADEVAPGGRQLYVNGSCAVDTNLWSWNT